MGCRHESRGIGNCSHRHSLGEFIVQGRQRNRAVVELDVGQGKTNVDSLHKECEPIIHYSKEGSVWGHSSKVSG